MSKELLSPLSAVLLFLDLTLTLVVRPQEIRAFDVLLTVKVVIFPEEPRHRCQRRTVFISIRQHRTVRYESPNHQTDLFVMSSICHLWRTQHRLRLGISHV